MSDSNELLTQENKPPEIQQMPPTCGSCDIMLTLGFLTSNCETLPEPDKKRCQESLNKLETGQVSPVDALADAIISQGQDKFNETLDRMNMMIFAATDKAKSKLIAEGKLNPDGTPVE